ncbi:hypothetical protein V5F79_22315 [Xanthobacter flavus]|uniref:ECs_2282 family putative zinc-binding protein n=1 Tax=Xanthobacter flavus TaxID=281 RepID=UPI00372B52F2
MSDKIDFNFTFECQKCGGAVIELPDDYTDASIAKCKACGQEFGTWGDVQAKARDAAAGKIDQMFRDTFKGLKGWKVK